MKDKLVTIRATDAERARWNAFAESQGKKLGAIIRGLIEREIAVDAMQREVAE